LIILPGMVLLPVIVNNLLFIIRSAKKIILNIAKQELLQNTIPRHMQEYRQ